MKTATRQVRMDRTDVSITWVLLWLTALVVTAATVGLSLYRWLQGKALWVPVSATTRGIAPELDAARIDYKVDESNTVLVRVAHPSVAQRLLDVSSEAVMAAAVIIGVLLAARVVRAVHGQALFTRRLVRTLRALGLYLALVGFIVPLIDWIPQLALQSTLNLPTPLAMTVSFGVFPVPWQWFLFGAFLGVLAEAVDRARRMQDDLEGLV